jgi:hypothetical protein
VSRESERSSWKGTRPPIFVSDRPQQVQRFEGNDTEVAQNCTWTKY